MEVKLKVLAGAKSGAEIPLKKDEFVIGRAADCTLRAGSDAISRRHCAIIVERTRILVRDLGSRNGTFVNDQRIEEDAELKSGDEVRVGPLRFQVLANRGLDTRKLPKVKDVADAAARTAQQAGEEEDFEVSISQWLEAPSKESSAKEETAVTDTTTMRLDETHSGKPAEEEVQESPQAEETDAEAGGEAAEAGEAQEEEEDEDEEQDARDRRKKPGKLPPVPKSNAKDSREAAAEVLRAITRRR